MTLFIGDIASYQGSLSLKSLRDSGFNGINLKVSHGIGQKSVHPEAAAYAREARATGMQLSCFHWLTGDASGGAQADYCYRQMATLGLNVPGVAHVVDVEGTATSAGGEPTADIYRAYVARMAALLGRPVATYSGKWWADARPWLQPSNSSPWLWGAPATGYQTVYPGDASPLWENGYAGYEALAVMQYRVAKIAGTDVSQSAVRSEQIWAMMTGGETVAILVPCLVKLRDEFNQVAPKRDKGADGWIGDTSHAAASSDHNPDETGNTPYEDADNVDEVHAIDVDSTGPWPDGKGGEAGGWFDKKVRAIAAREKVEYESPTILGRLQNIIWRGQIISRSWGWSEWRKYEGSNQHFDHAHFSARYESATEADTRPWGVATQEDEVTEAELIAALNKWATSSAGKKAIAQAVLTWDPGKDADGKIIAGGVENVNDTAGTNPTVAPSWALRQALVNGQLGYQNRDRLDALSEKVDSLPSAPTVDIPALASAIVAALPPIEGGPSLAEIQDAAEVAVREVFGDAATPDSPSA